MDEQIIFSYIGCAKHDFANEVSFNENQFSEKLSTLYHLNIQIDRIEVTIHHTKGEAETPFAVTIDVVAPSVNENKITEHGKDLAGTTRKAIDTTIQLFRKHKDKHSNH